MPDEEIVGLDGPVGRCGSRAAIDIGRRLALRREHGARLHHVSATEGVDPDGTATRWELGFDLPDRMALLLVVVTFTFDEAFRSFGPGVASLVETAFPAPGSELERMAVSNGLSRRRLRSIWRQTMADHRPLPSSLPDVSEVLTVLRSHDRDIDEPRSFEASVSRAGHARWVVMTRRDRYEVRWAQRPEGEFSYTL